MALGGYANRVAWIDLSAGKIEYKPIAEEDARKYIGGRGLGVKYVFDNGPAVDPLSPDNILCFMNGPLTGTEVNMSGRMAIVTKSPLTGTITDSHHGGWSAARLRWAGLDGLVFKGKAAKPVYAYVEDGKVSCTMPCDLWGKGVHETVKTPAGAPWRRRRPERDRHRPGRREPGPVCLLDQRKRPRLGPRRHRLRGRQQEPQGHRDQRQARQPATAGRQGGLQSGPHPGAGQLMDESITSPRKGGLSVYGTNVLMNITNNRRPADAQRPVDLVRRAGRTDQR